VRAVLVSRLLKPRRRKETLSEAASQMTSAGLVVDGGMTA
jgi:hypothetical protein